MPLIHLKVGVLDIDLTRAQQQSERRPGGRHRVGESVAVGSGSAEAAPGDDAAGIGVDPELHLAAVPIARKDAVEPAREMDRLYARKVLPP